MLFDLDGVLVDSRTAFARSVNAALVAHGLTPRQPEELHGFIGPPLHLTFAQLGAGDAVDDCVAAYRARYSARAAAETAPVPGIDGVLAALGQRVPLVVATSKAAALADPLLEALGLRRHFRAVVGPALDAREETKGTTIGRALLELEPGVRAVMVGDRRFDVEGAREHGLPAVGVLWGIGAERELRDAGAAALATRPAELPVLLGW